MKPPALRRSWIFLGAADAPTLERAYACPADALIADLEDGTPPHLRPQARATLPTYVEACRRAGKVACVRINPLHGDGLADIDAVLRARPDVVFLPKTESAGQVVQLADHLGRDALEHIELVPNVETALGLVNTFAIASAHARVTACLMASEDMTTSLGAERSREGVELQYARGRFLVECKAAGVVAIDCPYTFSDAEGLQAETRMARRLGYTAKSGVDVGQAIAINRVLTPSAEEVARARHIVEAFERAHAAGERAEVDGNFLEVPIYLNAKRLIERHDALQGG